MLKLNLILNNYYEGISQLFAKITQIDKWNLTDVENNMIIIGDIERVLKKSKELLQPDNYNISDVNIKRFKSICNLVKKWRLILIRKFFNTSEFKDFLQECQINLEILRNQEGKYMEAKLENQLLDLNRRVEHWTDYMGGIIEKINVYLHDTENYNIVNEDLDIIHELQFTIRWNLGHFSAMKTELMNIQRRINLKRKCDYEVIQTDGNEFIQQTLVDCEINDSEETTDFNIYLKENSSICKKILDSIQLNSNNLRLHLININWIQYQPIITRYLNWILCVIFIIVYWIIHGQYSKSLCAHNISSHTNRPRIHFNTFQMTKRYFSISTWSFIIPLPY